MGLNHLLVCVKIHNLNKISMRLCWMIIQRNHILIRNLLHAHETRPFSKPKPKATAVIKI